MRTSISWIIGRKNETCIRISGYSKIAYVWDKIMNGKLIFTVLNCK